MPSPASDVRIRQASESQFTAALTLVFSRLPTAYAAGQVEALLADVRAGKGSMAGLQIAERLGRLRGAIFSQVQPGKAALVWPPRVVPEEPATTLGQLLTATTEMLEQSGVRIAECLVPDDSHDDQPVLETGGYKHLANLLYLVSMENDFPTSAPQNSLTFEPYSPSNHLRLTQIVEQTYEQTHDCPQLNGVRAVEDTLTGYRAAGVFEAQRWLLICHDGRDVGCLLLADYPEQENWELLYVGLIPSARGRGWGKEITQHAQWLARQAGRPRLVLAVDAANAPALQMYAAVGFRAWERRRVFVRILGSR
jgi:ribosomal protein S18 acetylase RimI-like enzyme